MAWAAECVCGRAAACCWLGASDELWDSESVMAGRSRHGGLLVAGAGGVADPRASGHAVILRLMPLRVA